MRTENKGENLEEAEKVTTGKFGCEMKGGKWRKKKRAVQGREGKWREVHKPLDDERAPDSPRTDLTGFRSGGACS